MTLNNDGQFEEKMIFCFKNGENFVNFFPEHSKVLKICTLIGSSFMSSI